MKVPSPTTVGGRIRAARERSGETQQSLATRAGLAVKTLSRAETDGGVQLSTVLAIAKALDVSLEDLIADTAAERVVTPDELDALAVVQAEIREIFETARSHIMGWDPFAPSSPPGTAAACPAGEDEA